MAFHNMGWNVKKDLTFSDCLGLIWAAHSCQFLYLEAFGGIWGQH